VDSQAHFSGPFTAVYLVAIEDIVQSPIVGSQVIELVKAITAGASDHEITLVSVYPLLNLIRFRSSVKALRRELAEHGVTLRVFPLLYLTRYFYVPIWLLPLFLLQALLVSLWVSIFLKPGIVHCRSYPAAVIGALTRRFTKTKFVFDTRNLYPEEGATLIRSWQAKVLGKASYTLWKEIEARLMRHADATVVVSEPTVDVLVSQYPSAEKRLHVIPQLAPVSSTVSLQTWRRQSRRKLGLAESDVLVAYMGTWFEPEPTIQLFRLLQQTAPDIPWHFMLLVSKQAQLPAGQHQELEAYVLAKLEHGPTCTALSLPHEEVAIYLAGADLAAHPFSIPKEAEKDPLYLRRLGTWQSIKYTEYLAAGLPIIVSQWVGAVAQSVLKRDLGVVYDLCSTDKLASWIAHWHQNQEAYRRRAWEYADSNFRIEIVAQRYLDLYQTLAEQG